MNRQAKLDQIITAPAVFFLCVGIMGLFVIMSSGLSLFSSSSHEASIFQTANLDSQALIDVFLHEKIEGITVKDRLISNWENISKNRLSVEEHKKIFFPLEEIFNKTYSCGGKNSLFIAGQTYRNNQNFLEAYLDFPAKSWSQNRRTIPATLLTIDGPSALQQYLRSNSQVPEEQLRKEFNVRARDPNGLPFTSEEFGEGYVVYSVDSQLYVGVKVNEKC